MKRVLILGRKGVVVGGVQEQLHLPDTELLGGMGIDDVRSAFARGTLDHVIMGAGIELDTRLEIIREIFRSSETTTVHMKDQASGPQGLLPFARSVLVGLSDYEI